MIFKQAAPCIMYQEDQTIIFVPWVPRGGRCVPRSSRVPCIYHGRGCCMRTSRKDTSLSMCEHPVHHRISRPIASAPDTKTIIGKSKNLYPPISRCGMGHGGVFFGLESLPGFPRNMELIKPNSARLPFPPTGWKLQRYCTVR